MSVHYRERRDAGAFDPDEETRQKAETKFDKQWNKQLEEDARQAQEETTSGTANPK